MSGWKLSIALVNKHFGKLGDSIAEALANFDPETATEVDREVLQGKLREIALKLADARRKHTAEQDDVTKLQAQIAQDTQAVEVLLAKFEKGEIDEALLAEFADNLEAEKARLPVEVKEADDAKELVDTLQEILNTIEQKLTDFDRQAKAAKAAIATASANLERQQVLQQNQREMADLKNGLGNASTALGALGRRAAKLQTEADAAAIVTGINQKPIDRANAVEEARRIASGGEVKESAADRLRRLAGK